MVSLVGVQPGAPSRRVRRDRRGPDYHSSRETNLRTERSTRRRPRAPSRVGALEPPLCRWSVCNRVPPLDACAATAADLTITAQERQLSEPNVRHEGGPNVRHEGGRARHRGWARWNRRGVVGRCATGFPRSSSAPRAPRAYSTARLCTGRGTLPLTASPCVRPRRFGLAGQCGFPPSSHATYRSIHRTYASPHTRPRSNAAPSTIPLYSRTTCNLLKLT